MKTVKIQPDDVMYVDIKGDDAHYHSFDDHLNYEEKAFGLEDS